MRVVRVFLLENTNTTPVSKDEQESRGHLVSFPHLQGKLKTGFLHNNAEIEPKLYLLCEEWTTVKGYFGALQKKNLQYWRGLSFHTGQLRLFSGWT